MKRIHLCALAAAFGLIVLSSLADTSDSSSKTIVLPPEIGELDLRFRRLLKERVTGVYSEEVAKLNAGYLGGVGRAVAVEQAAGRLDGVLALEAEKKRVESGEPLPESDEGNVPAVLKSLRAVYREELAKLVEARSRGLKVLADPLDTHLAKMESDFTRGGRLDDAKAVRVYRVELADELKTLGMASGSTAPSGGTNEADLAGTEAGEVRVIGGIKMVWCPAGSFTMGSPADELGRLGDEELTKTRLNEGFWLAATETTQKQWESEMEGNPSYFKGADLPVERVSWIEARSYADKRNEGAPLPEGWKWALPTEAQWEYACRAGTETAYHFGDLIDAQQANVKVAAPATGGQTNTGALVTAEVGSYPPNPWGLHDMHGNVREWCADWHGMKLPGGTDPTGPEAGTIRVRRGGSWNHEAAACRSASRHKGPPDDRNSDLGFRLAIVRAAP